VFCAKLPPGEIESGIETATDRFLAYRHETGAEGEPTAADANAFLTHLAMIEKVSPSTQSQPSRPALARRQWHRRSKWNALGASYWHAHCHVTL
jgi:hypothetical protein